MAKVLKPCQKKSLEFSEDFSLTSYFNSVHIEDPSQEDIFVMKDKMTIMYNYEADVNGNLTEYAYTECSIISIYIQ